MKCINYNNNLIKINRNFFHSSEKPNFLKNKKISLAKRIITPLIMTH